MPNQSFERDAMSNKNAEMNRTARVIGFAIGLIFMAGVLVGMNWSKW
jgi:tetrahydromethanopterin S-methyltransferase subunit F